MAVVAKSMADFPRYGIKLMLAAWLMFSWVEPWRWEIILLGIIGVLIVVRPFRAAFHPAMLMIIYNAVALALYSLMTRRLSGVVAVETMQFYMGLVGTLLMLPFAIWTWTQPETIWGMLVLISLGVLGWAGHQLLTNAHRFGTANQLMPFTYSFLVFVAIWGYLLFGTVPDTSTILGAIVIMSAGLMIWGKERR